MATPTEQVEARQSVTGAQVALILLGLVALLGVLWFLFLRGGGEETIATPPVTTPTTEPAPEETSEPDRGRKKGPLQTFEVFAPKDPFKPLIAADTGTAGAPAAGGSTGGTNGSAPSGGSDISGGGGGSQNVGGRRVRLIDTFRAQGEARARVQVDGTVYTVGEGDRFADNFEVVSISGSCASLLFGDDQFSLCEGEEILK
jgi:hypothetical protein